MNEQKTKKIPVRDLMPSRDAKGGRHGNHGGHHHLGAGHASKRSDGSERAGKYWL
jgi:hypothetical protein